MKILKEKKNGWKKIVKSFLRNIKYIYTRILSHSLLLCDIISNECGRAIEFC